MLIDSNRRPGPAHQNNPLSLGIHDELFAVLVATVDLDLSALDYKQGVGRIILVNDDCILRERTTGTGAGEHLQFLR